MKQKYNYISLFSGAGIGCYGFQMEGFECIATNELLQERINIQKYNNKCKYESGYIVGDISQESIKEKLYNEIKFWENQENIKDVDVIIATPPCQGMSTINYKKNNEIKRNSLVVEAIKIIEKIKPKIFIFENVKSFMQTNCTDIDNNNLKIEECINKHLENNYEIFNKIINFKDYGVPSSRPRTIVIGTRKNLLNISPLNIFPLQKNIITVRQTIGNLKSLNYGEIDNNDIYHFFRIYPKYMQEWIANLKEGESAFDEKNTIKPYKIVNNKKVQLKGAYIGNKFKRMLWNQPAPCVTTRSDQLSSQTTIHPKDDRVLSIRELMIVMTIPNNFNWCKVNINTFIKEEDKRNFLKKHELNIRRAIGEAIPTEILHSIAKNIKDMFDFEMFIKTKDDKIKDNFYINAYKTEINLKNTKETGSFYTPQSVVFNTIKNIKINKDNIKILEPSVGMGAFLPQLLRLVDHCSTIQLDLIDTNLETLNKLQQIFYQINYNKNNLKINYIQNNFLFYNTHNKYDLIISNPPYIKLKSLELKNLQQQFNDKNIVNMFGLFMYKIYELTNEIVVIVPKTFLMTPEFNQLRMLYQNLGIVSIIDYGAHFFKNVFIEIISIHFKKNYNNNITIYNAYNQYIAYLPQKYIFHNKIWLIYRNKWFDNYIATLKLNIFNFYRDRQITNKYLLNDGKIRVIKSKNLLDNGEIININNYDKYINNVDLFNIKKYINTNSIIITNFTYNIRATYLPKNSIVNGSLAILTLKDEKDKQNINLNLYSTSDFRKYYSIIKNNSKFTINIDSNSIYYIGIKK